MSVPAHAAVPPREIVNPPPEVSVVIGVRDAATSVGTAIASVLAQTGVALEVIVVDDGSTDATPARLAALAAADPRVRILTGPALGLTHALARGCAQARGEFIARQDATPGTRWLGGRLARTVALLRTRADVVLVGCGTRTVSPRGERLYTSNPDEAEAREAISVLELGRFRGPSSHAAVTFRRHAYEAVGGYREAFRFAQDVDLWLRLLEKGSFGVVDEVLVERGASADGTSGARRAEQQRFAALALEAARLRRAGGGDDVAVAKAREMAARVPARPTRKGRADGLYFLGACLADRDPPAAHRWFADAIRAWPLHGRAWARWAASSGARRRIASERDARRESVRRARRRDYRSISIVIPTWRREEVLIETVGALLALPRPADEIILVDQTRRHRPATTHALAAWAEAGLVRIVRRDRPSLPAALNHGFRAARGDLVLCLDDDIVPSTTLVEAHLGAHREVDPGLVAGRVLQPWDVAAGATAPRPGPFTGTARAYLDHFMGGNFSAPRREMLALGGFDERFVAVAYRNENELATRLDRAGRRILFEPLAEIRHLQAMSGGVRAWVGGAATARPAHAVGEYYHLLRSRPEGWAARFAVRPWRHLRTRDNLRRPWRIPACAWAEIAGMLWALSLHARGPRLMPLAETLEAANP